jgi:hypothetical protein
MGGDAVAALCAHIRAQRPDAAELLAKVEALGVVPDSPRSATEELRDVLGKVEAAQRTFAQKSRAMENQRKQFVAAQEACCTAAKTLAELEARAGALTARLRDTGGDGGASPGTEVSTPLAQVMSLHEQGKEVKLSESTMPGFEFLDEADQQRVTADLQQLLAGVIQAVGPVKEKLAAWKADCVAAQLRAAKKRKGEEADLPAASGTDAAAGDASPGAGSGASEPAAGGAAASGGRGPATGPDARGLLEQARAAVRESADAVRDAKGSQSDP